MVRGTNFAQSLRICFKSPDSVAAHSVSSNVVQYPRCQVVCAFDEETQLKIGMVDPFDPGVESEIRKRSPRVRMQLVVEALNQLVLVLQIIVRYHR